MDWAGSDSRVNVQVTEKDLEKFVFLWSQRVLNDACVGSHAATSLNSRKGGKERMQVQRVNACA